MEIRLARHGRHVAIVTIDNQQRLNAMTRQMLDELGRLWDELERDDCRCIILTGVGERAFTVGADISGDLSAGPEIARMVNHALLKNEPYSKPIIAAVNSDCVGGGLELAAVDRYPCRRANGALRPDGGQMVDLSVWRFDYKADPADRLRPRHGPAADGAIDRCRPGSAVGPDKSAGAAGRADGLGDRDGGDDCRKQPIGGTGGQTAGQRNDCRSRAD